MPRSGRGRSLDTPRRRSLVFRSIHSQQEIARRTPRADFRHCGMAARRCCVRECLSGGIDMRKTGFTRAVIAGLLFAASAGSALAAANCVKGEHKPPFKLGWANIYSVPTWMKETTGTIEDMANELKKQGLVDKLTITDAQGNANTQIQQIQSMIDAKLDAIIVDAGSATALDRVIADACAKGIVVTNFDSLVDTKELTTKIDTDQTEWGKQAAEWLVKQLNGKGNIIVLNGPAGVSVSDDRRKGADPV